MEAAEASTAGTSQKGRTGPRIVEQAVRRQQKVGKGNSGLVAERATTKGGKGTKSSRSDTRGRGRA